MQQFVVSAIKQWIKQTLIWFSLYWLCMKLIKFVVYHVYHTVISFVRWWLVVSPRTRVRASKHSIPSSLCKCLVISVAEPAVRPPLGSCSSPQVERKRSNWTFSCTQNVGLLISVNGSPAWEIPFIYMFIHTPSHISFTYQVSDLRTSQVHILYTAACMPTKVLEC